MFYSFYVILSYRDFFCFLWFENNDLDGVILEFCMNVYLFGVVLFFVVVNYSFYKIVEIGCVEFGDKVVDFLCRNFYVDDGFILVFVILEVKELIEDS